MKSRLHQESHAKDCFEIEELRRICREETEAWTLCAKDRWPLDSESALVSDSRLARLRFWMRSFFTSSTECPTRPRCCFFHTWALPHFHSSPTFYPTFYRPSSMLPHFHSSPTFFPTFYQTFIDVRFTRRLTLRGSIECLSVPGWNTPAYRLWAQISHWRTQLYIGQTNVLPRTEYDVDLWISWKHCDSACWIGLGWWANTEYAAFTTVLPGERSKCRPITTLSLLQRKLSVKFVSLPRKCRETCRNVRTQKKVESRNTFRQRRRFLRASTSSSKRRNLIQVLWSGRSCEISSWRTKRSSTRRSKNWTLEARIRMQSGFSQHFLSWVSKTRSFRWFRNGLRKLWRWKISKRAGQTSWRIGSSRKSTSRNSHQKYPWSGRIEESSGNANWRIFQEWIERKSRYYTGAHFTNTGVGKNER